MVQSYSMYFLYYKPPHTRFECLKGIAKLQCGHNSCIEHSFNQECLRIFRQHIFELFLDTLYKNIGVYKSKIKFSMAHNYNFESSSDLT